VGDPRIDPSDGIRNICTVNRNFIADKKILGDIFLYPFPISNLLLNGPSTVLHLPYLKRRFLDAPCEGWDREEEDEESYQKAHG
jgi:hypothetical protein